MGLSQCESYAPIPEVVCPITSRKPQNRAGLSRLSEEFPSPCLLYTADSGGGITFGHLVTTWTGLVSRVALTALQHRGDWPGFSQAPYVARLSGLSAVCGIELRLRTISTPPTGVHVSSGITRGVFSFRGNYPREGPVKNVTLSRFAASRLIRHSVASLPLFYRVIFAGIQKNPLPQEPRLGIPNWLSPIFDTLPLLNTFRQQLRLRCSPSYLASTSHHAQHSKSNNRSQPLHSNQVKPLLDNLGTLAVLRLQHFTQKQTRLMRAAVFLSNHYRILRGTKKIRGGLIDFSVCPLSDSPKEDESKDECKGYTCDRTRCSTEEKEEILF